MGLNWDLVLLLGILLCQGITGFWAFHVSVPAGNRLGRLGFAVVTIVGMGLAVYADVRANSAQESSSKVVTSKITSIQTGQTQIAGQLDRLGHQLNAPSARSPATNPPIAQRIVAAPEQHARIVVSKIETVLAEPIINPGDMGVRIWYANKGSLSGYSPTITAYMQISDPIAQSDVDKEMDKVRSLAFRQAPARLTEMSIGDEGFRPFWRVSANDWQSMLQGKKQMYVFVVLAFADSGLPKNQYWVSEFAMVQSQDASVYMIVRQKTYLHTRAH